MENGPKTSKDIYRTATEGHTLSPYLEGVRKQLIKLVGEGRIDKEEADRRFDIASKIIEVMVNPKSNDPKYAQTILDLERIMGGRQEEE